MRRAGFLPAVIAGASILLITCGEAPESGGDSAGSEATVETVEDPCDCLGRDLTDGQRRYCRESKRDTQFLESLRNCGMGEVGGVSAVDNMPDDGQYTMDKDRTIVEWQGRKAGMVEKGTVPIRACTFSIEGGRLTSGDMVVEMNGIQATSQTGQSGRELGQHLRSADFFDVSNHPTAAYTVTSSRVDGRGNLVLKGKLNVKGQSEEVEALMSFASADPVVASVNFAFDRADFDVRFGSGSFFDNLGDNLIADNVEMRMALIEDTSARKSN